MPIMTAIAAGIGAIVGLSKNQKRKDISLLNLQKSQWLWELEKENREKSLGIIEGNITAAALGATRNSREAAMQAFQAKAQGEVVAGTSGASAGTPFYKLDQDVRDNLVRLAEMEREKEIGLENAELQAKLTVKDYAAQDMQTEWALGAMEQEYQYTSSLLAAGISAVTGAFTGMQTWNNIQTMAINAGWIDPAKTVEPTVEAGVQPKADSLGSASPMPTPQLSPFSMPDPIAPPQELFAPTIEMNQQTIFGFEQKTVQSKQSMFSYYDPYSVGAFGGRVDLLGNKTALGKRITGLDMRPVLGYSIR